MTETTRVNLGVEATVVMDRHTHSPRCIDFDGRGLREVLMGEEEEAPGEELVDEIYIASTYSLHVALYALQNPTEVNIARALYKIGTSGDVDEHIDPGTLYPLPVPEPPGWDKWVPGD